MAAGSRASADGDSEGLDCEFVVVDGQLCQAQVLAAVHPASATTPGHAEAGEISRKALRAMLRARAEFARATRARQRKRARKIAGWGDFDQLRFVARLGVRTAQDGYRGEEHDHGSDHARTAGLEEAGANRP